MSESLCLESLVSLMCPSPQALTISPSFLPYSSLSPFRAECSKGSHCTVPPCGTLYLFPSPAAGSFSVVSVCFPIEISATCQVWADSFTSIINQENCLPDSCTGQSGDSFLNCGSLVPSQITLDCVELTEKNKEQ